MNTYVVEVEFSCVDGSGGDMLVMVVAATPGDAEARAIEVIYGDKLKQTLIDKVSRLAISQFHQTTLLLTNPGRVPDSLRDDLQQVIVMENVPKDYLLERVG